MTKRKENPQVIRNDPEKLFWSKVPQGLAPDECWEWTSPRWEQGYGAYKTGGKMYKAHRVMWEKAHGMPIPDGLLVCHTCDNPPCVNPAHLFLGTHVDNGQDMSQKGRGHYQKNPQLVMRGEAHPHHELNERDVLAIRRLAASRKYLQREIAEMFGITTVAVSHIVTGRKWASVPATPESPIRTPRRGRTKLDP